MKTKISTCLLVALLFSSLTASAQTEQNYFNAITPADSEVLKEKAVSNSNALEEKKEIKRVRALRDRYTKVAKLKKASEAKRNANPYATMKAKDGSPMIQNNSTSLSSDPTYYNENNSSANSSILDWELERLRAKAERDKVTEAVKQRLTQVQSPDRERKNTTLQSETTVKTQTLIKTQAEKDAFIRENGAKQ
ncbi:hypothetical protein [Candidatus Ulvibacter alkanivorans]|uniref:hypothetical protein n=1 Tax=Candidatus Ulvibacter alkanivorans TaxID=2267620 RepID=UPI000DF3CD41|nr:hypothetical protein [Candidatus Ulvibacter alkanivorans]